MNAAIGKLLTNFDGKGRAKPAEKPKTPEFVTRSKEARREPQPHSPSQPQPAAPKADAPPVNLLDDAYRRGHAAGLAEGEAALAEERVRGAITLSKERAKWVEQQVAIVNGFGAACHELENSIASAVVRILQPFLADAVRDKAVAQLVEQISALTSQSPVPVFRVTGPSDLLDLVRRQLPATRYAGIEYQVADVSEIRVVADQSAIETQISVWIERLKDAAR